MCTETKPIHPGDTLSAAQVARIYDGLRDRSLPKAEWTHGAHLTAGAAILDDLGLTQAERVMPDIIRAYNYATGGRNTETEGYHHTITLLYLRLIDRFLAPFSDEPLQTRATRLLASPLADKDHPLTYYSRERLFSVEARRGWVAPDLRAIEG